MTASGRVLQKSETRIRSAVIPVDLGRHAAYVNSSHFSREPRTAAVGARRAIGVATARRGGTALRAGRRRRGDTCQARFEVPSCVRRQLAGLNPLQTGGEVREKVP